MIPHLPVTPRVTIPPVRFTPDDLANAWEDWGCNCGPTSLAVVLGITLDEAHAAIPEFDARHYTNPTMMIQALRKLHAKWTSKSNGGAPSDWPAFGLARIQWDGPWCAENVPFAARYRHSHWVACATNEIGGRGIFDCNCPYWIGFGKWNTVLVPHILKENEPKASGKWWVTNAIEVTI